jgi:hypothetical protein
VLAFAVAFVLGYLVNFFLNFLMNVVAFWTLETFAIQLMVRWASDLLGGQISRSISSRAPRHDRRELAVRGDLLDAAAHLHRRAAAFSVARGHRRASAVARIFRRLRGAAVDVRRAARHRSGRVAGVEDVDLIVIGSGQGGIPLARDYTAAGKHVVLFERGLVGGTCVNNGCTPSKAFLAAAHSAGARGARGRSGSRPRCGSTRRP